jgi:hypothetical protein
MAWKKKGAGTAAHAEQRELKPPVFSCGPSYTIRGLRPVWDMVWSVFDFQGI